MSASDSIVGGSGVTGLLNAGSQQALDKILTDTIGNTVTQTTLSSGSIAVHGTDASGNQQGAITPPTATLIASITDGALSLNFQLPDGTGLVFEGKDNATSATTSTYLNSVVTNYLPVVSGESVQVTQQRTALLSGISNIVANLVAHGTSTGITVRMVDLLNNNNSPAGGFTQLVDNGWKSLALLDSDNAYQGVDSLVGANEIMLDASSTAGSQVFAINLAGSLGKTLVLKNVEAAVLGADGTVRVDNNTPVYIASDNRAQNITGGGGNDTLIGTGNDTLTGGAGSDIFGFSGAGKYIVTDFNKAVDKLAVNIAGVTNFTQLQAHVTGVTVAGNSITYNLDADISVTLIGVSATDLTASMINFNITS